MLDSYNRTINYLRISVTDRCNLRCTYCMPAQGIALLQHTDILSIEEILDFARVAVEMGINKVRLTGGEPLVRKGILTLIGGLSTLSGIRDLCMSTNGILLAPMAHPLRQAGLHRINISLDSMDPIRYAAITRGGDLQAVLSGIQAAREAGFDRIKLNCVIENSPDEPDAESVRVFARSEQLELRYIIRMETHNGKFSRVIGGDGGHCPTCNRLRLSSTGMLYPCLFSDQGFSIREHGAKAAIEQAITHKPAQGQSSHHQFYQIGG